MQKLIIKGKLPSRNQAEFAARSHWSTGSRFKKRYTEFVYWVCKQQRLFPVSGRVKITITFYEQNLRRDSDNVISANKYILDGLVMAGIIQNDTKKCVELYINPVELDRENPRIEVEIEEFGS